MPTDFANTTADTYLGLNAVAGLYVVNDGPFRYELPIEFTGYQYDWHTGRKVGEWWQITAGCTPGRIAEKGDRIYQPLIVNVKIPTVPPAHAA